MPTKITYLPFLLEPIGSRLSRAAQALPTLAAPTNLFTIVGGKVLLTLLLGEVTTVVQAQANATKLTFDPDDAGATQDLCTTLDITADPVGTIYSLPGLASGALIDNLQFGQGPLIGSPRVLKPGKILLNCAATNTGAAKWDAWFIALDVGAYMIVS
jgi:hypothetical protein